MFSKSYLSALLSFFLLATFSLSELDSYFLEETEDRLEKRDLEEEELKEGREFEQEWELNFLSDNSQDGGPDSFAEGFCLLLSYNKQHFSEFLLVKRKVTFRAIRLFILFCTLKIAYC